MQRVPEEEVSFGESWMAGIAVDRWDNTKPRMAYQSIRGI